MTNRPPTCSVQELESLQPAEVLMVGDAHGNARFMADACRTAQRSGCPVLVQVGDFGLWPGPAGEHYLDQVAEAACRFDVEVCWIDGNHEDHQRIATWSRTEPTVVRPQLTYLPRGLRWSWHGTRFGAMGGAFSVDWRHRVPGETWWPNEVLTDADVERLGDEPLDVLVCHDSPAEMPMRSRWILRPDDQASCDASRRLLQESIDVTVPSLVVHGHWHHRHSRALHYINQTLSDADSTAAVHWSDTQVEGLGADISDDRSDAWFVLTLPSQEVSAAIGPSGVARATP